ncbi:MAG: acetyl-CoA carboxylase, carboxyltransferase subunit beta [Thermodesulfovibrionales bacterium]|jgi:acetyl-CoA carboxylase carboxyl transferase subunit beta|nr:acetyl-CoA carboxylase, carboxyltransferase subunit beta [Thermodesulfovibrionales bacterium]
MAWFKKTKETRGEKKGKITEGLWVKCDGCKEIVYKKEIEKNLKICPKCNYHFRISARERLKLLVDEGSFVEIDENLVSVDPLHFKDSVAYKERLKDNQRKSGIREAVISGDALIRQYPATLVIMDFSFMGGSMGSVVGEKVARAAERALEKKQPLIAVSSSGGARMQEGIFSLMQMAKVSASIGRLKDNGILYISVLCDPTFGGVTASFASLGDIIIAEPKSLIGFAGPRVIEQTMKQPLPDDFQRADFLLEHGLIDMVVDRKNLRDTIAKIFELLL